MVLKLGSIKFLFAFLFIFSLSVYAQNLNVVPLRTKLLNKHYSDLQEGGTVTQYNYKSQSSQKIILDFYRLLFVKSGFEFMEDRSVKNSAGEDIFYFSKPNRKEMVILSFFKPERNGVTYMIVVGSLTAAKSSPTYR